MNEKVTIQLIIDALAEKHDIPRKDAEAVVRKMFDLIEEALTNEKYIKIKGLGTFKLTEVDSRESVNIKTGERIQIQGHSKISFTPDTSMKELINKPFGHFETVILNKGVLLEDTPTEVETEDDDGLLSEEMLPSIDREEATMVEELTPKVAPIEDSAEVNFGPVSSEETIEPADITPAEEELPTTEETLLPVEETNETVFIETTDASETPQEAESAAIPTEEEEVVPIDETPEPAVSSEEIPLTEAPVFTEEEPIAVLPETENTSEEPMEETTNIAVSETLPDDKEPMVSVTHLPDMEEKKSSSATLWGVIIALLILACVAGGGYWWFMQSKEQPSVAPQPTTIPAAQPEETPLQQPTDSATTTQTDSVQQSLTSAPTDTLHVSATEQPTSQPKLSTTAPAPKPQETPKVSLSDTTDYDIIGTQATYTLHEGETLIKVSSKFYGNRKLWPYIVKHNKNIIKDADRVPVGTTLRIPELSPRKP